MLPKCKSLCAREFGSLFDLSKSAFTSIGMFFGIHFDIVLGIAQCAVFPEKSTISTMENIHLWIGKLRIHIYVHSTVLVTNEFGPGETISITIRSKQNIKILT